MKTGSHKTGDMCNINHQDCIDLICNLSESLEIDCSAVCTGTCYNQFWLTFKGNSFYFIIINKTFFIDTVRYAMEILAGEVR